VRLTPLEYRLLAVLLANAGKVMTHRQLLREVWGQAGGDNSHYLRIYVGHLRHKLEDDPAQPATFSPKPASVTGFTFDWPVSGG
jgi:two-component system KDP operon response regulator KdpE